MEKVENRYTFDVQYTLGEQDMNDVLTTAIEGGIDYWAQYVEINRAADLTVVSAHVVDAEDAADDPENVKVLVIDAMIVARGVQMILSAHASNDDDERTKCTIRRDLFDQVMSLFTPDIDVDADAADCIVQAGLFGEVVYG